MSLIWSTWSEQPGSFVSLAVSQWEIVITTCQGETTLTVRGPETRSTPARIPEEATFLGIQFKLGTFMPQFPLTSLVDTSVNLPTHSGTFWLDHAAWELPTYDNADVFVARLVRAGLLAYEPLVERALRAEPLYLSPRSVQRSFLRATGLSRRKLAQIERARYALRLLESGMSILDTVACAGYADQPHLTRALRDLAGQTPAQIVRVGQPV